MDEDELDFPEGTLQRKQEQLMKAISDDKDSAWQLLQEEPIMVIALTKVRRDLEGSSDSPVVNEFFEEYHQKVRLIFSEENPLDRYGIALTAEFLTEYWRQTKNSTKVSSVNEAILKKLALLMEATEHLPDGADAKITHRIVDYSTKRIIDFDDYDDMKAKEHISLLEPHIEALVDNMIGNAVVTDELLALAYFASASTKSLEVLRNRIASVLFRRLEPRFPDLDEEDKFKIAPWLRVFEVINRENSQ